MSTFKRVFVPRNKGGRIVEVDWSQLEVAVLQIESQDETLGKELRAGMDTHSTLTADIYGVDYEYVIEEVRKHNPVWVERRRQTKRAKFALQYGAGPTRISMLTGWPKKESAEFIDRYYTRYAGIKVWQTNVAAEVAATAKPFGVDGHLKGQYTSPNGRRYVFETSENFTGGQSFSPNQMKNYPIQGLASDFVGLAGVALIRSLLEQSEIGTRIFPINTIHDSMIFDVASARAEGALFHHIHTVYGQAKIIMESMLKGKRPVNVPLNYTVTSGTTWSK